MLYTFWFMLSNFSP